MPDYRVESCTVTSSKDIKQEWSDLQKRADCSYFQSWGWIEIWLDQIAIGLQPVAVKVWFDESLVGIGLFVSKDIKRRVIFRSHALFLNEYPFDDSDMVIEYNGLMAEKGLEEVVYTETLAHLFDEYEEHEEFHFGAIKSEPDYGLLEKCATSNIKFILDEESVCWQVALDEFEPGLDSYLASLSKNSREQIRRSLRLYEEKAPVTLKEAESAEEALAFFESMEDFHTKRWQSKGEVGSFANPKWVAFNRTLIQKRFKFGEIQMIRIANSYGDIAFLFNCIWQRRVYVLQMGFNYREDKRFKPGYLAHTLAIVHNRDKGMIVYDFMHGEARYKKSLGSSSVNLYWAVLQRPRLKFKFEQLAVDVVRRLRKQ